MSEEMTTDKKIRNDAVIGFEYLISELKGHIASMEVERDVLLNNIPYYKSMLKRQQFVLKQINELDKITEEVNSHIIKSDCYGDIPTEIEGSGQDQAKFQDFRV